MASKNRSKQELKAILANMADPEKVLASPEIIKARDLLQISYELGEYPYAKKMKTRDYEEEKILLQTELLKVQSWAKEEKKRIALIFEGRDAAGKGGTIKRFMEHLNPRAAHIIALEKPTERERGQWYYQRYIKHLPSNGQMVLFDRSWYNRAGVEPVMNFCSPEQHQEFLEATPKLENMLIDAGLIFRKFWFSVSRHEQLRRFHSRTHDPLKHWKLSPIDIAALNKWEEYTDVRRSNFAHTDTTKSPWTVVKSDDKKRARINCMRFFLHGLDYPDKDASVVFEPDNKIIGPADSLFPKKSAE